MSAGMFYATDTPGERLARARLLMQVIRAALSSANYAPERETQMGIIALIDVIDGCILPEEGEEE